MAQVAERSPNLAVRSACLTRARVTNYVATAFLIATMIIRRRQASDRSIELLHGDGRASRAQSDEHLPLTKALQWTRGVYA